MTTPQQKRAQAIRLLLEAIQEETRAAADSKPAGFYRDGAAVAIPDGSAARIDAPTIRVGA
jgi:hypothetical protein